MDPTVETYIAGAVRAGFRTKDEIVADATELADDEGSRVEPAAIEALVDAAIRSHRIEEATWPSSTDNDRLDAAFAALERAGVIARQDFACCMSCGQAEILDEVDEPDAWRGYTFFHQQDTELAVEGGVLYLAYGAVRPRGLLDVFRRTTPDSDTKATPEEIGRDVVAALERAGLHPTWDGRSSERISIAPFEWRRRHPTT